MKGNKKIVIESRINVCSLATLILYMSRNSSMPATKSATIAAIVDIAADIVKNNGYEHVDTTERAMEIINSTLGKQVQPVYMDINKSKVRVDKTNVDLANLIMEDMKAHPELYKDIKAKKKRIEEIKKKLKPFESCKIK